MHITLNGEPRESQAPNLTSLVESLQLGGRRVAVERNGEIVPRSRYADTQLAEGDRIEIVQAIGGG